MRLAGKYELLRPLGAGAMGQVWLARDHGALARDVAIKVIKEEESDEHLQYQFRREAKIASELSHPRIMRVFDADWHEGQLFIVMELLRGSDLKAVMGHSPRGLPVERTVDLGIQLADGLSAVHARSIVHRDLKPANLFIQPGDQLKICDFGLARDNAAASQQGMLNSQLGTPLYAPPEWWVGKPVLVEPSADLYTTGGILYEMLTGRAPFADAPSIGALMMMHIGERPVPPHDRNPAVPPALSYLVLRLLSKEPADRGSAKALYAQLQEVSVPYVGRARPTRTDPPVATPQPQRQAVPPWPASLPELSAPQTPAGPSRPQAANGFRAAQEGRTATAAPRVGITGGRSDARGTRTGSSAGPPMPVAAKGKARGLIAAGIAVVAIAAAIVTWQAHVFGGGRAGCGAPGPLPSGKASSQLRPLAWTCTETLLPSNAEAPPSQSRSQNLNALTGVSCPTNGTCVAVGNYNAAGKAYQDNGQTVTPNEVNPLVERLSNDTWKADEKEPPSGNAGSAGGLKDWNLAGIICSAPSTCTAAGTTDNSAGLIATLSSAGWTSMNVPSLANAVEVSLDSLACPTADHCIATGYTDISSQGNQARRYPLIVQQAGKSWKSAKAPLPPDAAGQDVDLKSVACTRADACMAVGYYTDKNGTMQGLIDTLAGNTWTAAKAPLPADANGTGAQLDGVSCASGGCVAVGSYGANSGTDKALIESLPVGTSAPAKPQSPPHQGTDQLSAIHCLSITSCIAVGESGTNGLVATLTAGKWTIASVPVPANNGFSLNAVDCPTAASCEAVGQYQVDSAGDTMPFVETGSAPAS